MEKILNDIKKNKQILRIMGYFEEHFQSGYDRSGNNESAFAIRDTLFRRWYYSAMLQMTYLNPSYMVNQIAQEISVGEYVIMPHVKPVQYKMDGIQFKHDFKVFTVEEHPVLIDIEKIIELSKMGLHIEPESGYVIRGGSDFIDEINYRNSYYLMYLLELIQEMKLVKSMPSIGTVCLVPAPKYELFMEMSKEEQLVEVADKSINISLRKFNEECYMLMNIDKKEFMTVLGNGVEADKYDKIKRFDNLYVEDIIQTAIEDGLTAYGDNEPEDIVKVALEIHISKTIDMWFTTVFGYYLGMMQPNYYSVYNIAQNMEDIIESVDIDEREGLMFRADHAHDLTVIGERIISKLRNVGEDKIFSDMKKKDLKDIMEHIGIEMERIKEMTKEEALKDAIELLDEINNQQVTDIAEHNSEYNEVERIVKAHVDEFYTYLIDFKGVTEKTALKHAGNIWEYQMEQSDNDTCNLAALKCREIEDYMGFYIENLATSKSNVKEQFTSFKQYGIYMEKLGLVDNKDLKDIKELCKRKDEFAKEYDRVVTEQIKLHIEAIKARSFDRD